MRISWKRGWLLLLFGLFISPVFSQSYSSEALTKRWELTSFEGQDYAETSESYFALFSRTGTGNQFQLVLPNDTIKGDWALKGDSLMLMRPLPDVSASIDSMAYVVEEGEPRIDFYSEDEQVTTVTLEGMQSQQATSIWKISGMDDKTLSLQNPQTGDDYTFEYRPVDLTGAITVNGVMRGLLGMIVLLGACWLLSANRGAIDWRLVGSGILIQLIFALLVLKVPAVRIVFEWVSGFFVMVLNFTYEGSVLLFGDLMNVESYGYIFAFQVLPTIVFFSALSSLLYYLGILQKIVYVFAWVMNRTMHLSGAESLAAAANIFIGQTEAPLVVKPYLEKMTKSEMLCLMVGGMATIAGGVFAAYVGFLGGADPVLRQFYATHLLTASIMSAPAAIVAAKILFPEPNKDMIDRKIEIPKEKIGSNVLDAISNGTTDGLRLAVNVGVMLLTFTALIYMFNSILGGIGDWFSLNEPIAEWTGGRFDSLSLDFILGVSLYPIAWVLGVPPDDALLVGQLLGKKTIVNEFIAYQSMEEVKAAGLFMHQKSVIIATYALCGFANFASIGIQIGGIGALAPGQRKLLARFGIRALIGGTVAAFMTAVIAGVLS